MIGRAQTKPFAVLLSLSTVLGLVWQFSTDDSARFFFSRPSEILGALLDAVVSGQALIDAKTTFGATVLGVFIGLVIGGVIGVLGLANRRSTVVAATIVAAMLAFPILAIAPMFMLWFGTGFPLKLSLAATLASLVISAETLRAREHVDRGLFEMAEANRWRPRAVLAKLLVPAGIAGVLSRMPSAANAAFLGAFVGEFIASDRGVGYRILRAGSLYQADTVLAYSFLAVVLLVGLQGVVKLFQTQMTKAVEILSIDSAISEFLRTKQ